MTAYEQQDRFLEGTGSLVCDHVKGAVYASLSSRTDVDLVQYVANEYAYTAITFHAVDEGNNLFIIRM